MPDVITGIGLGDGDGGGGDDTIGDSWCLLLESDYPSQYANLTMNGSAPMSNSACQAWYNILLQSEGDPEPTTPPTPVVNSFNLSTGVLVVAGLAILVLR